MADDNKIIAELEVRGKDAFIKALNDGKASAVALETAVKDAGVEGGKALDKLGDEAKETATDFDKAEKAAVSYKTQLRAMQAEIVTLTVSLGKMKDAGKAGTAEFVELEAKIKRLTNEAGELKDVMGDVSSTISNAGSDTRGLDKTLRGLNSVASGFQLVEGAAALFGSENEELQKTLVRLNAIMAITNALQQIQDEALKNDSVITAGLTKVKAAYSVVVGQGTAAMKLFRLALAATGIGLVIIAIAAAVKAWNDWNDKMNVGNKLLADAKKAGADYYASETSNLNTLLAIAKNKELSDATRQAAIDKINQSYPEYLSNLNLETINTNNTNKAIGMQIGLIAKLAMLKGTVKMIEELGEKLVDIQTKTQDVSFWDFLSPSNWGSSRSQIASQKTSNEKTDVYSQMLKLEAQQKQLTTELDKAGFGDQALAALGVEVAKATTSAAKAGEVTAVKEIKKEVEHTPLTLKVEAETMNLFEDLDAKIKETEAELVKLYSGDVAAGEDAASNPQIIYLIAQLKKLKGEVEARKGEFDTLVNGSRASGGIEEAAKKVEGGSKEKPLTLFEKIFGTEKENEESQTRIAEGAKRVAEQLASYGEQISSIASSAINIRAENDLRALQQKKDKGLISEKEYEKQSAKIKNEAARKKRAIDIANATAQIPIAMLSAFIAGMQMGGPILAGILTGLAGAFGIAQVAILAATPLPQFKHGGSVAKRLGHIKGNSHEHGGVKIEVEGDEFVMNKKAVARYGVGFMEKINDLKYNPILASDIRHKSKNNSQYKLNESLATIGGYLRNGAKIDSKGNDILMQIRDNLNTKTRYV